MVVDGQVAVGPQQGQRSERKSGEDWGARAAGWYVQASWTWGTACGKTIELGGAEKVKNLCLGYVKTCGSPMRHL